MPKKENHVPLQIINPNGQIIESTVAVPGFTNVTRVQFEQWLKFGAPKILQNLNCIAQYNPQYPPPLHIKVFCQTTPKKP